jgi:hypothetical protein
VSYRRRSALEAKAPAVKIPRTLEAGVLSVFPDANPRRLAAWLDEARAAGAAEPEPLLFLILVVGVRLRVSRDEVVAVFEDLWTWLAAPPRLMQPELAELVIEALTPELRRAIKRRGWRFGPGGELTRRQGRPPEARAAWTAALIAENHFVANGAQQTKARTLAISLAAVLLGRQAVEAPEFYRSRRRMGVPDPSELASAIIERYEEWLSRHAKQLRDPAPLAEQADLHLAWRGRHRPLAQLVGMYGAEKFARLIFEEIREELWVPFSKVEISGVARARKGTRKAGVAPREVTQ